MTIRPYGALSPANAPQAQRAKNVDATSRFARALHQAIPAEQEPSKADAGREAYRVVLSEVKPVSLRAAFISSSSSIEEMSLRAQQEQAREEVNLAYAMAHPYLPVGQVMVDGKLFATVFDSGAFTMEQSVAGLSEASLSPAARLAEIAKAVGGSIKRSDLIPVPLTMGPGAPESMLPPLTARSHIEILQAELANFRSGQTKA